MKFALLVVGLFFFMLVYEVNAQLSLPEDASTASDQTAFSITNTGLGGAGLFRIKNTNNEIASLGALHNGFGFAFMGLNIAFGSAGAFANLNEKNNNGVLLGYTDGTGSAGVFLSSNKYKTQPTLIAANAGLSSAAQILTLNEINPAPALEVNTIGPGDAISAYSNSQGCALSAGNGGTGVAIYAYSAGSIPTSAIYAKNLTENGGAAVYGKNESKNGRAGVFGNGNRENNSPGLEGWTKGTGCGVEGWSQVGDGMYGVIPSIALEPEDLGDFTIVNGLRAAVRGEVKAEKGNAGIFEVTHSRNFNPAIWARHEGIGWAIYAENINAGTAIRTYGGLEVYGENDFRKSGSEGCALSVLTYDGALPAMFSVWNGYWAAYFKGSIAVDGDIWKGGGGFKIDHPLDPENKYLYHSFVESPDMMNVYNGNVVLDKNGEAWVELPDYFEALNKDFRYQLTPIGASSPNLHINKKIHNNRFKIAGGKPDLEVSWQITGIRKDAYAKKHRTLPEVMKEVNNRGKYLHAKELGQADSLMIGWQEISNALKEKEKISSERKKLSVLKRKTRKIETQTLDMEKRLVEKDKKYEPINTSKMRKEIKRVKTVILKALSGIVEKSEKKY